VTAELDLSAGSFGVGCFGRKLEIGFHADRFCLSRSGKTARAAARFFVVAVAARTAIPEAFAVYVFTRIASHAADSTPNGGISLALQITVTKEGLMVDNMNPSNQFHPYQPETSTPAIEKTPAGLSSILQRFGQNVDVKGSVEKARGYARANPGMVLGGLAAAVIGAGLMRSRRAT
jgi:hypothetical protein